MQGTLQGVVDKHGLVGVRVDIDESGGDYAVLRVDDARTVLREVRTDRRNASALNGDVRLPTRLAGSIDDRSAADEKVGHECRRSRACPRSLRFATTRSLRDRASAGFPS